MSFYTYQDNSACPAPGPTKNAADGLCERTCVQVKKVYDSCMQQVQLEGATLELTHPTTKERLSFVSDPPDAYPWNLFTNRSSETD